MKVLLGVFALSIIAVVLYSCKGKSVGPDGEIIYKDISVEEAKGMISNDPNMIVLDVRTPGETSQGTIPNALVIDYRNDNFDAEIAKLDKSKTYLVYCKSGGRSVGACQKMKKAGFDNLINMKGGYSAWK